MKRKWYHFDEFFVNGYTESLQNDNGGAIKEQLFKIIFPFLC